MQQNHGLNTSPSNNELQYTCDQKEYESFVKCHAQSSEVIAQCH